MRLFARRQASRSVQFWILASYLAFVFLVGGGSRGDTLSLIVLRPTAILVCGVALLSLNQEHIRKYRVLFGFALALFLLVGFHLIKLPPPIWEALPGREIVTEIDTAAQLDNVWRPVSLVPLATWNAFYALFVPLAAMLLAVQLTREEQYQLLPLILGLGFISGMLGLLQVGGARESSLYLYEITNYGSAVGLFANRNHQSALLACLFPMLAVYASIGSKTPEHARFRIGAAIVAGLVLVPLLLVTGSRAGFALGLLGLLSVPLLYRRSRLTAPPRRRARPPALIPLIAVFGAVGLMLTTIFFARAEALKRIMSPDALDDVRINVWGPVADMAWKYFPIGSGIGSFANVYKISEPDALLMLAYLNHAHNDWLELFMTGGAFGGLLLAAVTVAWGVGTVRVWRGEIEGRARSYGKLASILLLMLGLASMVDYPLRVPSLACFAVILAVWLREGGARRAAAGAAIAAKSVEV